MQPIKTTVDQKANPWNEYATAYAQWLAPREQAGPADNAILSRILTLLGDVAGREVLDAGCGEGYFARILAAHGARVTGLDLSSRLIEMAREKDPTGTIDYRVGDLSCPLPELDEHFDLIGSYMVLNDVADHRGFATTLASLAKRGARATLGFNNPYSFPMRGEGHVMDYFASGARGIYGGMSQAMGGEVCYYHRTLEEYIDAFLDAGFRLAKLADVIHAPPPQLGGNRFPLYMVLAFDKP